ncbi:MAG: hypothetical protein IKP96_05355 [Elusimicrobiaceae bacterium]|nr:hypothetical protein [Elusimicrobiaceae bacterium]
MNKKGMSVIGLLLAALIIGILLKLMIAPYKQQASAKPGQAQHIQTQSQAKQTVDRVRAQLKQAERAANKRANAFERENF